MRDGELDPSPALVDICLESVDVLRKTLRREWPGEADMRASVDSLLGRIAQYAPLEAEEESSPQPAQTGEVQTQALSTALKPAAKPAAPAQKVAAATKSVRIALGRLDRMMNTVGELVISRTKMVGRVAELEKMIDTLSFSKERLHGKVNEFQEKYEYNRIRQQIGMPWSQ